jgi:hypothetical protein
MLRVLSSPARIGLVLVAGLAFGVVAAVIKGGGGGEGIPELRSALGNLSTPWLLVAFVAGTAASSLRSGALYGVAATAAALTGFYLVNTLVHDLDQGYVRDLRVVLSSNRGYLEGGVVTGPLFGVLGAWWQQRRKPRASIVAGVLLIAEPVALVLLGAFGPDDVFSANSGLPAVIRLLPGWGLLTDTDTIRLAVYAGEFIFGLALVFLAVVRSARAPAVGSPSLPET